MKNIFKLSFFAFLITFGLVGCSSEETTEDVLGTGDPDPEVEVATIKLTEGGAADDIFYAEAQGQAGGTVDGRVIFTTSGDSQKRLYVTQTLPGGSPQPFPIAGLTNKELKADESIDLDGALEDGFDFTFTLNVPSSVNDGSIIYNFWSTTGKGDFRDSSKRLLIGVGTIEVKVGTGSVAASVRSYDVTLLDAPLLDGSSDTFMSLLNGDVYKISDGEEYAALWDFGYYYGNSNLASLGSTSNYPALFDHDNDSDTALVAVSTLTGVPQEELNSFYIARSGFTSAQFDTITDSQLATISQPTSQVVTKLIEGEILEFVDAYGTKGLIEVSSITTGFTGSITLNIKVQNYSPVLD